MMMYTLSQALTAHLKPSVSGRSCRPSWCYLAEQLGVAGHQLRVLLLQLVVALLGGLRSLCTVGRERGLIKCTFLISLATCMRESGCRTFSFNEGALEALVLDAASAHGLQLHP